MTRRPPVILCFGDSNTHGTKPMRGMTDIARHDEKTRWPMAAQALLQGRAVLIEEGHPGRTTVHADPVEGLHKQGSAALPVALESHRPLDGVVIMLGTNDLKARFGVSAWEIALGLSELVRQVQASGCGPEGAAPKVLILAPPPILEQGFAAEVFRGGAAKSAQLAARFAEVAAAQGCGFLDAGARVDVDPLDGIHLDAAAHMALGREVARAIRAQFGL